MGVVQIAGLVARRIVKFVDENERWWPVSALASYVLAVVWTSISPHR